MLTAGTFLTLFIGLSAWTKVQVEGDFAENTEVIDVTADGTTTLIKSGLVPLLSENLTFSERELDALLYMKEEEKLAGDVYKVLYEKWASPVFSNISKADPSARWISRNRSSG